MKSKRLGLIFAYPWNEEWCRPSFTRWGRGGKDMRKVALSFGRFALVFDITWYLYWMHNVEEVLDYGK